MNPKAISRDELRVNAPELKTSAKTLTLDEIEQKMIEIATCESTDVLTAMINEKKLAMLEKIANLKIHRLQLKDLEKNNVVATIEPITVEFVKSKTPEQIKRLEKIDEQIIASHQPREDA